MPREDISKPRGPAREVHSADMPIEQRRPINDAADRDEREVILVDRDAIAEKDYLDALAFMEEPVTIRLEPSADVNAITRFPVWVNGIGAEVFQNGRWVAFGWLPVGQVITVRRKVLEVIARTKIDRIQTDIVGAESDRPNNKVQRHTSAVHAFSVIEDRNPRGAAWLTEMVRRNF